MLVAPYYRNYELPWETDRDDAERFRRLLLIGLGLWLVLGIVLPMIHLPEVTGNVVAEVPPRLARLMEEEKPKPPPPKPPELPKPEEKPKPQDKPKPDVRKKMENSSQMRAIKDALADLRDEVDTSKLQSANLSQAVLADARADRNMISSRVGTGSAGVANASTSRGFGAGAGALGSHNTAAVTSAIAASGNHAARSGASGKAARGSEEIETVFDANKGAIYALYNRALRDQPDLQGKLVLQLTITPAGDVSDCHVVSSELKDPELERKIVARVKLFKFQAKDVETITATKTIEFFPA